MTLEETLQKLTSLPPTRIEWEIDDDPDGRNSCVFRCAGEDRGPYQGRRRVCLFCEKPLIPSELGTWKGMEIETSDHGKVYIFICGYNCFGAPKIQAPPSDGVLSKIKRFFDMKIGGKRDA